MTDDAEGLLDSYLEWLRREADEQDLGADWTSLSLPFLDRHNDYLQLFIRRESDGVRITDEGRIIRDLAKSGCDLKAVGTKRRRMAATILKGVGLGVDPLQTGEISALAINGDFPEKLHSVLMSMMAIDGLANASPPNVAAMFRDDVVEWLTDLKIVYEVGVTR